MKLDELENPGCEVKAKVQMASSLPDENEESPFCVCFGDGGHGMLLQDSHNESGFRYHAT